MQPRSLICDPSSIVNPNTETVLPKPNEEVASSLWHGRRVISLGACGEQKDLSGILPSCTQSGLQASAYAAVIQLMELLCDERSVPPHRPTRSKIIRARVTLSDMTAVRRGEGRLISGSRARRTAAMIAAAMTTVDFIRVCSCICPAQASRSRAIARFISPIRAPQISRVSGQVCTTACREISRTADSFSSLRRVETTWQSRCPASSQLAPGCSHHTSCSGS